MKLQPSDAFPMPGTYIDDEIVVASVHYNEDEHCQPITALVLTVNPNRPGEFYRTALVGLPGFGVLWANRHPNIVPAVEHYQQQGGDW